MSLSAALSCSATITDPNRVITFREEGVAASKKGTAADRKDVAVPEEAVAAIQKADAVPEEAVAGHNKAVAIPHTVTAEPQEGTLISAKAAAPS